MRKVVNKSGLSFIIAAVLAGCQPGGMNQTALNTGSVSVISKLSVSGRVELPSRHFGIKATLTEAGTQATVSLVYPSNHVSKPNVTVATGLTDSQGSFTINPSASFSPVNGEIFILEAVKRIGLAGSAVMSVRTYLKWNGSGWSSITTHGIRINTKTSALTIIDHYDNSINPADCIGKIDTSGGTSMPSDVGSVTAATVNEVADMVTSLLGSNEDPTRHIGYKNSLFYIINPDNPAINYLLSTKNCPECDFKFDDLSNNDLSGAELSGAELNSGNLSAVNLTNANLSGSNLTGANLTNAVLAGANLSGAVLTGSNLTGANLSGATWTDGSTICHPDSTGECLTPPATPTGLTSGSKTPFSFTAGWTAVDEATSYEISVDGGSPVNVGNVTSYSVTGLTGTDHNFKVRALRKTAASEYSEVLPVILPAMPDVYFVKAGGSGIENGTNWENAFADIQSAIDATAINNKDIWVAAGTYKPHASDTTKSFIPGPGVRIFGGFSGNEYAFSERNIAANPTILSGDLNNNNTADSGDSVNVLKGSSNATIDGFTVKHGFADGSFGGGMYNSGVSNMIVSNVIFSSNFAMRGGAMYNVSSTVTLNNIAFINNSSSNHGGALYNDGNSANMTDLTFTNNSSGNQGGGMYNANCSPTLDGGSFSGNSAQTSGGAAYFTSSSSTVKGYTFSSNTAVNTGGALYIAGSSALNLLNNDFSGNSSAIGGAIYITNSNPVIDGGSFNNNTASSDGGAIYIGNFSTPAYPNMPAFSGNTPNNIAS